MIASAMCKNGHPKMRGTLSSSSICFKVFPESEAYSEYGIRLMLAPRSAKARYSTQPAMVHGIKKLPGLPSLGAEASSSLSSWMTVVLAFGLTGGSYVKPLHVNTAFTCSFRAEGGRYGLSFVGFGFGLVWMLLGSEPVGREEHWSESQPNFVSRS
ncbi:hypothetical protein Tco_1302676 [Tanacetum coccineum]